MNSLREDFPLDDLDASFLSSASSITCSIMSPNSSLSQGTFDRSSSCSFSLSQSLSMSLSSASLLTIDEKQLNTKRWTPRGGDGDSALLSPQAMVNQPPKRSSSLYSSFSKQSSTHLGDSGDSRNFETSSPTRRGSDQFVNELLRSKSLGEPLKDEQQWEPNSKDCTPIMPRRRLDDGEIDEPINADSRHTTADCKSPNRGKNGKNTNKVVVDSSSTSFYKELLALPKATDDSELSFNRSINSSLPNLTSSSWGSSSTPSLFNDEEGNISSSLMKDCGVIPPRSNVTGNDGEGSSDDTIHSTIRPPPPPSYAASLMDSSSSLPKSSTHSHTSTTSVDTCAATAGSPWSGRKQLHQRQQQQPLPPQRHAPPKTRYVRKHKSDQSRRRRSLVDGTLTSIVEGPDEASDELLVKIKLGSPDGKSNS